MPVLSVPVSDDQASFLAEVAASGGHSSAVDAVLALVDEARLRRERDRLEALIREGIDSGPAEPFTERDWAEIRREVRERLARGPGS